MRKTLATIQIIDNLKPIPNADKIEVAAILGWECAVKKDEFKIGDYCVYIEIDSILPSDNPYFEFMKDRKYRVKTIKLLGQISQGLVCPMSILPEETKIAIDLKQRTLFANNIIGYDVTKDLNIKHYEELINEIEIEPEKQSKSKIVRWFKQHVIYRKYFSKKLRGGFPTFLHKTDEERIQNHPRWLQYNQPIYMTEKIDGTSATYFIKKQNWLNTIFGVCTRNIYQKTKCQSYYWQIAIQENIEKKLRKASKKYHTDLCIQGEIIGPKIQKNKYERKKLEFYVFNLFDIKKQCYASMSQLFDFCDEFDLQHVPIFCQSNFLPTTMQEMVNLSKGQSQLNMNIPREGIVVRSIKDQRLLSFKCINPDFLLKYGE